MRVNLRRAHILVSEQLLNRANVVTGFQKARGKRMLQRMATGGLDDSSQPYRLFDRPLQTRFAGMVAAHFARPWVLAQMNCRKHILPSPFSCGLGVFPCQRVRQVNFARSRFQIALVQKLYSLQMRRQLRLHARGQQGNAIFETLAVTHQDLVLLEEQVLHP